MYYNFMFYLALIFTSMQAHAANQDNDQFSGFKKGFLNNTEKSKTLVVKKPISTLEIIKEVEFDKIFDQEEINNSLWWDHRIIHNENLRRKIYHLIGLSSDSIDTLEENFANLIANKNISNTHETDGFLRSMLRIWSTFNDNYNYNIYDISKPNLLQFTLQVLINFILEAKFNYLSTLSGNEALSYRNKFISPDSNDERGELIFYTDLPNIVTSVQPFRYVREKLSNGKKIYRLVDTGFTEKYKITPILDDNKLSYYNRGEIRYKSCQNSLLKNYNALILDHNMELVQTEGLVLTKGWLFKEDYLLVAYAKHPVLDEMFFFEKELFDPNKNPSYLVSSLLDAVGGIEELDKRKFIFIPNDKNIISTIEAQSLLPLLYTIKELQKNYSLQLDWIPIAIDKLNNIIADDLMTQPNEELEQEIINEIIEEEIKQDLSNKNSQLYKSIENANNSSLNNKNKKHKPKKSKRGFINNKDIIDNAKKLKITQVSKDEVKIRRKLKTLAKIEEEYLNKTSKEKHFDTKDLHDLLGDIMDDFKNKFGINMTDNAHAKGSHTAFEIIDPHTQQTTKLSIARRAEKRGYQSGTVKTIIKEWITKVENIIK